MAAWGKQEMEGKLPLRCWQWSLSTSPNTHTVSDFLKAPGQNLALKALLPDTLADCRIAKGWRPCSVPFSDTKLLTWSCAWPGLVLKGSWPEEVVPLPRAANITVMIPISELLDSGKEREPQMPVLVPVTNSAPELEGAVSNFLTLLYHWSLRLCRSRTWAQEA